jgi:protein-disulfide isomerase
MSDEADSNVGRQQPPADGSPRLRSADEPDTAHTVRGRLTKLGSALAVVLAAIAIIVATTGAGDRPPPKPGTVAATDLGIETLLAGIPQHANLLGSPSASVVLTWFGDLECPYCKEFTLGALPSIIRKWVRAGVLKIEYRSMETATRQHGVFERQQVAALSAGMQNKMWYFIEDFYHEQGEEDSGYVTEGYLKRLASQVPGLNLTAWAADRHDPQLAAEIATDLQDVARDGFAGTPSFVIGLAGGRVEQMQPSSLTSPTSFNEAIERLLA